jgi:hypothetical protein
MPASKAHSGFAEEGSFYQMGIPPVRVDILMSIDGVSFAEAWPNRQQSKLGNAQPGSLDG